MKKYLVLLLCILLLAATPVDAGTSKNFLKTGIDKTKEVFKKGLTKARNVMKGLFQMTFLPSVPVLLHKDHFNTMFEHTNNSIDNIDRMHNGARITRDKFQDDKALHIKKSAELALHIQSLIGSKYLAYGITMAIGAIKEAIDGSFLNPNGSRSIEDLHADKVGASAVFGKEKYEKNLDKYMTSLVKTDRPTIPPNASDTSEQSPPTMHVPHQSSAPVSEISAQNKQALMRQYYEAVNNQNTAKMQEIGKLLQAQ